MKFLLLAFLILLGSVFLGIFLGISYRALRERPLNEGLKSLAISKVKVTRVVIKLAESNERVPAEVCRFRSSNSGAIQSSRGGWIP